MKKILLYIIGLALLSCNEKNTTLEFLDAGMDNANFHENELLKSQQVTFMKISAENMEDAKPYMEKLDTFEILHKKIRLFVLKKKKEWQIDSVFNRFECTLTTKEKGDLFCKVNNLHKAMTNRYTDNDIKNQINNLMNIEKYKKQEICYSTLNLIQNKINRSMQIVVANLCEYARPQYSYFKFNLKRVVVIPNNRKVKIGETFEAKIYFALLDTTTKFKAVIDNDTIQSKNGFAEYITKADKTGEFSVAGNIIFFHPKTKEQWSYAIPFQTTYNVNTK